MAKGLAAASVRNLHVVLHSALSEAVRLSLLPRNVADGVRPPRKEHVEMHVYDESQAALFIEHAQRDPFGPLYIVAITTGMRLGEITALRWKDVDLDKGVLQVNQSLASVLGKMIFVEPKTRSSRRTIRLTKVAIYALRKQRMQHLDQSLQLGEKWNADDLVFPNSVGKPLDPHGVGVRRFPPF
ncbi:MAG: site-specific integrase [Ktedonobacterales bacterium]|nr:site-specific integrase [Ktedonobacterales bacterium]